MTILRLCLAMLLLHGSAAHASELESIAEDFAKWTWGLESMINQRVGARHPAAIESNVFSNEVSKMDELVRTRGNREELANLIKNEISLAFERTRMMIARDRYLFHDQAVEYQVDKLRDIFYNLLRALDNEAPEEEEEAGLYECRAATGGEEVHRNLHLGIGRTMSIAQSNAMEDCSAAHRNCQLRSCNKID